MNAPDYSNLTEEQKDALLQYYEARHAHLGMQALIRDLQEERDASETPALLRRQAG